MYAIWTPLLIICLSWTCSSSPTSQLLKPNPTIKRLSLASQISGKHPGYLGASDDELWAIWKKAVQGAR
ncbi:hypothetical protein RB195_003548 [Necator americanus]